MKLRIKYFEGATKLKKITKGNWIDVYAAKDVFVPLNEKELIPLGFALELPKGYEGHLLPRSSTFKTWGVIQTNGEGIIDDTYIGDNDQWHMPVFCLESKCRMYSRDELNKRINNGELDVYAITRLAAQGLVDSFNPKGTWIRKGDKIAQFRIQEVMPEIEFSEVDYFGNRDRGGFGSTGKCTTDI